MKDEKRTELRDIGGGYEVETRAVEPAPIPEGMTALHISLSVSAAEMATWKPERIARFFEGLAQALMARGWDAGERDARG